MSSKEDILEQLVEEYLIHRGYFVRHNVKFRPQKGHPEFITNQDSNHSDIDVLGFHPKLTGPDRVLAVSCKSWQIGFDPAARISDIENDRNFGGRKAWKLFRELVKPKWSEAFISTIHSETGSTEFHHVTALQNSSAMPKRGLSTLNSNWLSTIIPSAFLPCGKC